MIRTQQAVPFTPVLVHHGEGPIWMPDRGGLSVVDLLAGDIVAIDDAGAEQSRLPVGAIAAAFRPRAFGGLVVAVERGFALVGAECTITTLDPLWSDPGVRMNDGGCDTRGRFYCGSMAYDESEGAGALHRLELDGSSTVVLEGCTIANGLDFDPDGSSAVHVDSPTQQVRRYALPADDGAWRSHTVVVEIDPAVGTPDGLCVDRAGGIWVALWGGRAVHRYTGDGELTDIIEVPVDQVTSCVLGGPELRTLFITTSARGVEGDELAGAVFRAEVTVPGRPVLAALI